MLKFLDTLMKLLLFLNARKLALPSTSISVPLAPIFATQKMRKTLATQATFVRKKKW